MIPLWLLTTRAKLIGVGVLILVLGWAYRRQIVKAEERGAARKEESLLKEEGRRIDAQVQEKLAEYAQERAELEARRNALASEREALLSQRREISLVVSRGISDLAGKGQEIDSEIRSLAGPAVNARARAAIVRAESAGAELARIRAAQ